MNERKPFAKLKQPEGFANDTSTDYKESGRKRESEEKSKRKRFANFFGFAKPHQRLLWIKNSIHQQTTYLLLKSHSQESHFIIWLLLPGCRGFSAFFDRSESKTCTQSVLLLSLLSSLWGYRHTDVWRLVSIERTGLFSYFRSDYNHISKIRIKWAWQRIIYISKRISHEMKFNFCLYFKYVNNFH